MHCWRHKTPIIYRATTQWFAGMDDVPGFNGDEAEGDAARRPRCAGIEPDRVLPELGQGAAVRHDREPARLDAVAPAAVGRAAAVLRRPGDRRAASATRSALLELVGARRSSRAASRRGSRHHAEDFGVDAKHYAQAHRHARRLVRLRHHAPDGDGRTRRRARPRGLACRRTRISRPTSISKARTSIAAGSIRRCSCRAC